ncbi:P-loop containing nucleoside triphosphate hydrolase protein [Tribonema minus]|uniref:P-loop containing nucleoside triphosphate hydrolase protein n=1 Tax=Tribonema minus TaxID=303371 RepID=A0A836CGD5_9STRA|nr:P-loop containing nucleoside triphosphate hydrolase protein [Tribonema minus]
MNRMLVGLLVLLVGLSALSTLMYVTQKVSDSWPPHSHTKTSSAAAAAPSEVEDSTGLLAFKLMPLIQQKRPDANRKTVIITGHGRSGSTLTGSIFRAPNWVFNYEPLKLHDWPAGLSKRFDPETNTQCRPDPLQVYHKMRCPVADMMYLLDLAHCRTTDMPLQAVTLEVDDVPGDDVIRRLNATAPLRGTRDPACARRDLAGVAVKTIRINGHMDQLFALSEKLGLRVDLVIHLMRDPRAVLASRYSVGWGMPENRSYDATLAWARDMCGRTMADSRAGGGRVNYMALRYEDLAAAAVARTQAIYERLERDVPPTVLERMRKNDAQSQGGDSAKGAGGGGKGKPHQYGVGVRNFIAQLTKWRQELSQVEQNAVAEGCREVLRTFYSDIDELVKKKSSSDGGGAGDSKDTNSNTQHQVQSKSRRRWRQ